MDPVQFKREVEAGTLYYLHPHPLRFGVSVFGRDDGSVVIVELGPDIDPEDLRKGMVQPPRSPSPERPLIFAVPEGDEEAPPSPPAPRPAEPDEESRPFVDVYGNVDGAGLRAWANDVEEMARGNGSVRLLFGPNAGADPGAPPTGIAIAAQRAAAVSATIDPSAFDPHHIGDGITVYIVETSDGGHASFGRADLQAAVARARDDARFRLRTSWVGVWRERSLGTDWKTVYYVCVRDGDMDASVDLFDRIEAEAPPMRDILGMPELEVARAASCARRHAVVRAVVEACGGTFEEAFCKEKPVCDFVRVDTPAFDVYANGFVPSLDTWVIVESFVDDGLTLLGPTSRMRNQEFLHAWPTHMPLDPEHRPSRVLEDEHYVRRLARRDAAWRGVEALLGADYGVIARDLEPLAFAASRALHENPYANL